ncbi:MAG: rhodanese-like domain-containing protein [Patescibacteria group bacterium]|jgi:rhodanese-related sulfurtransferase
MKKTQKLKENIIKTNPIKELVLPFLVSFLTVFLLIYFFPLLFKNKKNVSKKEVVTLIEEKNAPKEKIKELIELEKYLYVDPLVLLKLIDSGDKRIVLVDIRDSLSYKKAHIKGAFNYSIDQLKKDTSKLNKKKIIIYGDTTSSVLSKEMALLLINKGIDTRLMSVGWNEFRHFKNLWVPESQWGEIDVNKYIQTNE